MNHYRCRSILSLATLAILGLAASPCTARAAPFRATGEVDRSSEVVQGNIVTGNIINGQATFLGPWSGSFRNRFTGNQVEGVITMVGANGDAISVAHQLTFDRTRGIYVGPYVITGGTGRFAGATGGGTLVAVPRPNAGVALMFEGTIN